MKHEYHEGPEVLEKFNDTVKRLFQVPKSSAKPVQKPERKPKKTSKD